MTSVVLGLRLGRWGILGFSLAAAFSTFIQTLAFYQIAGHSAAERATFGESVLALGSQVVALFPPPIRPDTVGGYVEFRGFHPLAILFAIWALVSATGFARGDEERGIVESTLAAGISRAALVVTRAAAFAVGLAVAAGAAAAGFLAGLAYGHEWVAAGAVFEESALLVAIGVTCYALSLLVTQVPAARMATAVAGFVLLALYLLNSLSRVFDFLATWRGLSPFHYYDMSDPLPPGGSFDTRAFAVLIAVSVLAVALAAIAFEFRDLGSPLVRIPMRPHIASHDVSMAAWWRYPIVRGLYERRGAIVIWAAGMAALAVVFVSLTKTIIRVLLSLPNLLPYLSNFVRQQVYPGVLGFTWLNVAQLLFAALAISYVARWSAEDTDGRLEMTLSQPFSRGAVVVERMATLIASGLLIASASGLALHYASHMQGIDLNFGNVVAASLMLVPFALVFAAAGSLLAAWNPRAAVGLLGAFAFASYLDTELGSIFKLPLWVQDLSAFKLFGTPLVSGVDGRNLALLLLLSLAGVASSILAMHRRDVGA